jgi:hypothetical protein
MMEREPAVALRDTFRQYIEAKLEFGAIAERCLLTGWPDRKVTIQSTSFLFVRPALCPQLPADPTSRWRRCRAANISPCRVCRGPTERALPGAQRVRPASCRPDLFVRARRMRPMPPQHRGQITNPRVTLVPGECRRADLGE